MDKSKPTETLESEEFVGSRRGGLLSFNIRRWFRRIRRAWVDGFWFYFPPTKDREEAFFREMIQDVQDELHKRLLERGE